MFFTAIFTCMRLPHSNISIIIFDFDVDLIRVILIQCAQYEKTLATFQFSNSVSLKKGFELKQVAEYEL